MNQITKYSEWFKRAFTAIVDYIFEHAQKELGIEAGDEPIWSSINEYINKLTDECVRVLEWQKNNCELSSCTTPAGKENPEPSVREAIEFLQICLLALDHKDNSCQVTLNNDLGFQYRGFDCELSSCTTPARKEQLSNANNCFTDRYVCWLWGHKDNDGKTKEQSDDPECWSPSVYLVPDAWSWGADYDCVPGATVNAQILEAIDKLIRDVGEDNL